MQSQVQDTIGVWEEVCAMMESMGDRDAGNIIFVQDYHKQISELCQEECTIVKSAISQILDELEILRGSIDRAREEEQRTKGDLIADEKRKAELLRSHGHLEDEVAQSQSHLQHLGESCVESKANIEATAHKYHRKAKQIATLHRFCSNLAPITWDLEGDKNQLRGFCHLKDQKRIEEFNFNLQETNEFVKYGLIDQGQELRNKTISLRLMWDHMPVTGRLYNGDARKSSFTLPTKYKN